MAAQAGSVLHSSYRTVAEDSCVDVELTKHVAPGLTRPDQPNLEVDFAFESAITLRCKYLEICGDWAGWDAGIRTPITASREDAESAGDVRSGRFYWGSAE